MTMLTHWPLFPHDNRHEKNSVLTTTLLSYVNGYGKPLERLKCIPHQRWRDRRGTMIGKLMPFHWNQVTWSWLKPMPTGGEEKWRTSGRRSHMKWSTRLLKASLPTLWGTSGQWMFMSPPPKLTFPHCSYRGDFSLYGHELSRPGAPPPPYRNNSRREWDWGNATKCKLSIASPASDRWDSSRMGE